MSTNDAIRWGLLGTGRINLKLLRGASGTDTADVVAVGSRSAETGQAFAAANGIAKVHASYEALLADPEVDAVYIPLPNALHHAWTLKAIAAGKHVLCEKPYTRHPEQVDEAWDAAQAAGVVLMEAYMWRHTPQAARLVELAGQIGELVHVRSTFSHRLQDDRDIRVDAELEGGSLMDVGCYCISGSRLIAGEEPVSVYGEQVTAPNGVDRRFTGVLRFPSGLVASFHSGFDSFSESLEVTGREGTVFLPDPWHSTRGVLVVDGEEQTVEARNPYQCELEDMAAAIRGERDPLLGRDDALGQARVIEALYRSADAGEPVSLA
ncbi:MAG: Gfo/Idh/MocA family oxidoreductase [Candidatus Limnocylindrales bacterium]